jgi:hypothetical protein
MRFIHFNERIGKQIYGVWHLADNANNARCGDRPDSHAKEPVIKESESLPQKFCWNCRNINMGFSVEVLTAGQPRRYAGSVYQYRINAPGKTEEEVIAFCKEHLRQASPREQAGWLGPYIADFKHIKDDTWFYHVVEPFCD